MLSITDTVSLTGDEPFHVRPAKTVPEPEYESCKPGKETCIQKIFTLTNEERKAEDLAELSLSPTLCAIAQLRAADMAQNDYYAHESPNGETAFTLLQEYNILYFNSAENIGKGTVTNERMVKKWMGSTRHKENILSRTYHQLGVGIAIAEDGTKYWVQIFTN